MEFNAKAQRREGAKKRGMAARWSFFLFVLGIGELAQRPFAQADDGYADDFVPSFVVADDYAVPKVDAKRGLGRVYGYVEDVGFSVVAAF